MARLPRSFLEAIAAPDEALRWPVILQDLDSVLDIIDRDADRNFIADVAGWQRRIDSARTLTPNRLSWLADVLKRARLLLCEAISPAGRRAS